MWKGCDGFMAYTVIPLQIDEHRDALRRLWRDNSYDPETNVYAAERFDWLYRDTGASDAQTWLAVERQSQRVIGCGSVFRSNRSFRGQIVSAGVPAVFSGVAHDAADDLEVGVRDELADHHLSDEAGSLDDHLVGHGVLGGENGRDDTPIGLGFGDDAASAPARSLVRPAGANRLGISRHTTRSSSTSAKSSNASRDSPRGRRSAAPPRDCGRTPAASATAFGESGTSRRPSTHRPARSN